MRSWDAFCAIAPGVRPCFTPITRVGVFCFASCRSCRTSADVHGFPVFLVLFGMSFASFDSLLNSLLPANNSLATLLGLRVAFA